MIRQHIFFIKFSDSSWIDFLKVSNSASFYPSDSPPQNLQNYFDKFDLNDNVYGIPLPDKSSETSLKDIYRGLNRFSSDQYADENDLQMDESKYYTDITCEIELDRSCPTNEECIPIGPKSRQGLCNCIRKFARDEHGKCVKLYDKLETNHDTLDAEQNVMAIVPVSRIVSSDAVDDTKNQNITVSVVSKEVRLPDREVILSAFTIPDEKISLTKYKYLWSLISQPSGNVNGTMSDQTKDNIKLSNLSEGLYRFKVEVSGNSSYGEAYANVTVSPEKRINKAPIVIITPVQQTVKLPTSKAILDSSTSTVSCILY